MLVDSLVTLTIEQGTQLHFHHNSSLIVKGRLIVNGTFEDPVIFEGDRLEAMYDDIAGQWGAVINYESGATYVLGGIHFMQGSHGNYINFAEIKNGTKGIQIDTLMDYDTPALTLLNTKIEHMTYAGIFAQGSSIYAGNCVIADCGKYAIALLYGGGYEFYHCTVSNTGSPVPNATRTTPSVLINNYFIYDEVVYVRPLWNATFGNCIIHGSNSQEIELDRFEEQGQFNYHFDHCLIKLSETENIDTTNHEYFNNITWNEYPNFISVQEYNYALDTLSPAKDKGKHEYAGFLPVDIENNPRLNDIAPDLGAYERME